MASIHKRMVGKEARYDVSYREPDGRQRMKTFRRRVDAERFCSTVEADVLRGTYLDPDASRITFRRYAEDWLAAQTFEATTRESVALRLRLRQDARADSTLDYPGVAVWTLGLPHDQTAHSDQRLYDPLCCRGRRTDRQKPL